MQEVVVERKCYEGFRKLSKPALDEAGDGVDGVVIQTGIFRIWWSKIRDKT